MKKLIIIILNFFGIKRFIKKILNYCGYRLIYSQTITFFDALCTVLQIYKINTIVDVGANIGQFSGKILKLNYKNRLILIEPVKKTFEVLKKNFEKNKSFNKNIEFHNIALGLETSKKHIYKSIRGGGIGDMNSLLKISQEGKKLVKNSNIVDQELAEVVDINEFLKKINFENNTLLKLDAEGFDFKLLKHIDLNILKKIIGVFIEVPNNVHFFEEQEGDLMTITKYLSDRGFFLYNLDPLFINEPTGQLLLMDVLYLNKDIKAQNLNPEYNEKLGNPKVYYWPESHPAKNLNE